MAGRHYKASREATLLLAFGFCAAALGCGHSETYHGIAIHGSAKFARQIRAALELIRKEAPDELASIAKYVRRIEESDRSGMDASRSACQMAPATAYHSLTWCAGCIAHESRHAKLSQGVSYSYGHAQEELDCINYQRVVMKRIGAPVSELDYLATLDGNHFDANGDGEYSWEDYKSRDW